MIIRYELPLEKLNTSYVTGLSFTSKGDYH